MVKSYENGVLDRDSKEYKVLEEFCRKVTELSPNKHVYRAKRTYLDYGQGIEWITAIDTTSGCQVLSPRAWEELVNEYKSMDECIEDHFNNKYCCDKRKD